MTTFPDDIDVRTEWLLTNGLGGYAMGTGASVNTRRYHGLLVASLNPPGDRIVTLHSTIDQFHPEGSEDDFVPLSTQCFGSEQTIHPAGWRHLRDFHCDSHRVQWTWRTPGDVTIRRTLELTPGQNSCTLSWSFSDLSTPGMMTVRPLAVMRDHHALRQDDPGDFSSTADGRRCLVRGSGHSIVLTADRGEWTGDSQWWHHFEYPVERARGQDDLEDAFCAGALHVPVPVGDSSFQITVALQESHANGSPERRSTRSGPTVAERLAEACDQFVVARGRTAGAPSSVIAGYPWFMDWGRDSLISLPGLFLTHGRIREAISLLRGFAARTRRGIVPNRFGDHRNEAFYNTADASLWFIHAVHACHRTQPLSPPDHETLTAACRDIVHHYRTGTDFGIQVDYDGLLMAGVPGAAVTWMDARVDGVGVTARIGKPVELSALWHSALRCLAELVDDPSETADYTAAASLAGRSFRQRFWNERRECCFDVLLPGSGNWRGDDRIRPNQIFAVGLPFPPLKDAAALQVVATVRDHLLTPYGLRTLSPADPGYRGRYEGDQMSRDSAYHNGTSWPWLLGPYCDALRATATSHPHAVEEIRTVLTPLIESLNHGCRGQLAEIYDGDPPHHPHGCPAQAWSVAEVCRSWSFVESAEEELPLPDITFPTTPAARIIPTD